MPPGDHEDKWLVRPLALSDRTAWATLFCGYADFYERSLSDDQMDVVWRWIFDERRVVALVVTRSNSPGTPVGLAHLREWDRPLRATTNGYLDDLFVDEEHRGSGAVDALFDAIGAMGCVRGWSVVRWTTAVDNFRAQKVYDRYAERTGWVTYDLTVPDSK